MDALDLVFKNLRDLMEGGTPAPLTTSKEKTTPVLTDVLKSEGLPDERLFTAVVLRPNVVDAHGDIYDEQTVQKACHEYNEFCNAGNLQHMIQTDLVVPVESHIAKHSHTLGEGEIIAGDWVMTVRVDNDEIWELCKDGTFKAFSVGCKSEHTDLTKSLDNSLEDWAQGLKDLEGDSDD